MYGVKFGQVVAFIGLYSVFGCGSVATNPDAAVTGVDGGISSNGLLANPTNISFANTFPGDTDGPSATVITNKTDADVTMAVSLSGDLAAFSVDSSGCEGAVVAPNSQCAISVTFMPGANSPGRPSLGINVSDAQDSSVFANVVVTGLTPNSADLTVTSIGTGTGSVTRTPPGTSCGTDCENHPLGDVVLEAVPSSGSGFSEWTGACTGNSSTCTVDLVGDAAVEARFETFRRVTVSTENDGGNGTVTIPGHCSAVSNCSANILNEGMITLSAAVTGNQYSFREFVINGNTVNCDPCMLTVTEDLNIRAVFFLDP